MNVRQLELFEENAVHRVRVVLTGVDDLEVEIVALAGADDRGHLDDLRTGAQNHRHEYVDEESSNTEINCSGLRSKGGPFGRNCPATVETAKASHGNRIISTLMI